MYVVSGAQNTPSSTSSFHLIFFTKKLFEIWKQKSDFSSACFEFIHGMFSIVVVPYANFNFIKILKQVSKNQHPKISRDTRNSFESGPGTFPKVCALQNNFDDTKGDIHTHRSEYNGNLIKLLVILMCI